MDNRIAKICIEITTVHRKKNHTYDCSVFDFSFLGVPCDETATPFSGTVSSDDMSFFRLSGSSSTSFPSSVSGVTTVVVSVICKDKTTRLDASQTKAHALTCYNKIS